MRCRFGEYELDTDRFELLHAGERVPLEPQAFEVLAYLAQHPERVVSRQELLDAVWGTTFITDSALATRIKEARRAVGDDGQAQHTIRTVHGRGYRFVASLDAAPASEGEAAPPLAARPASRGAPPHGREGDLAQLLAHLDRAEQGERQVVFLSGESGIGKSTLLAAFLAAAQERGALIGRGQCIEHHGAAEAYLPLLEAAGDLARSNAASTVTSLMRTLAPGWVAQLPWLLQATNGAVQPGVTPERMLREIVDLLDALAQERTVVLAIEDLHWSDPSTLDVIELLARHTASARLLLTGTVRTPDLVSQDHDVHRVMRELATRGYAADHALAPLGRDGLLAFLEERAPGLSAHGGVVEALVRRTGGHPLFARNLLEDWIASGAVVEASGAWAPGDAFAEAESRVPDTIRQLIEHQLARLTDSDRGVLEGAAVAESTLTGEVVAAATGISNDEAEHVLARLARQRQFIVRAGLFEWPNGDVEDRYEFTHSLYREVLEDELPLARCTRMHRGIGVYLADRFAARPEAHADVIAMHLVRGRDAERAVPALVLAARRALSRAAYREARHALETGLSFLDQIADPDARTAQEVQLQSMLGTVIVSLEGWGSQAAEAAYDRALTLSGDDQSLRMAILYGLATVYEFRGEYSTSQGLMEERLGLIETVPAPEIVTSETHELLACSLLHQGAFREALAHGDAGAQVPSVAVLDTSAPYGGRPDIGCHSWSAEALWYLGQVDEAARRAALASQLSPDDPTRVTSLFHEAMVAQYRRDATATIDRSTESLAIAVRLGFRLHETSTRLLEAWARADGGDREALERMREGIDDYRASGVRLDLPLFLALYAEAALGFGELDTAQEALDEAFELIESKRDFVRSDRRSHWQIANASREIEPKRGYAHEAELYRLRALLLAARGEDAAALDTARHAVELARSQEARALELRALTTMVELSGTVEDAVALGQLLDELTEGHETRDWIHAAEVLAHLGAAHPTTA